MIKYRGFEIDIFQDANSESPREWDNVTTMIFFHRYRIGDNHDYNDRHYSGWDELERDIIKYEKPLAIQPVYMMDHSGLTLSLTPFGGIYGQVDSGQVGFIIVTNKKYYTKEKIQQYIEREIATYNQYLSGDVYGYTIEKDGEVVESCGGFYGQDEAEKEAKAICEACV